MRVKEGRGIGTVRTATGAMAIERACKAIGVPGRLLPGPRTSTAGCGMCWSDV